MCWAAGVSSNDPGGTVREKPFHRKRSIKLILRRKKILRNSTNFLHDFYTGDVL